MSKFMDFLEKRLTPVANSFSRNRYLRAIGGGFSFILPVIMLGAIFSLLTGLEIGPYQSFLVSSGLKDLLGIVPNVTTNMLSLYTAFAVAYQFVGDTEYAQHAPISGVLALFAFLVVTPLSSAEGPMGPSFSLSLEWLGAQGLFVAMILSLVVVNLYLLFLKRNWTIKMPEGVPPTIAKSFGALVPAFAVAVLSLAVTGIMAQTSFGSLHGLIYGLLRAPLAALQGSLFTYMMMLLISSVLWFVGIHGGMVIIPFMFMLYMQPALENAAAFAAGQPLPNILSMGTFNILLLGGVGNTLGLVILMALRSKSTRFKTLSRLSLLPGLCGINEPIIFGMPLILNPIMAIPYLLVPQINLVVMYFVMKMGLVGYPRIPDLPLGTPVLLDGFLQSGLGAVVLQIALIALSALIYAPFFAIEDKKAYELELAAQKETTVKKGAV